MKPLFMTIEGINSFSEKAEIDFERLSRNGIFCICGPTGSGKTTILDCVILALYAPSSHNRGYLKDYINTGCEKGKITLEFSADGAKYEVTREFRRNASSAARLRNTDTGEVLADRADTVTERIKKMLKLDKDDFTKVVVLEQGKYAEFMNMTRSKRYETVAKLFELQRFDVLKDKVAEAKRKYESLAAQTDAALRQYEGVTEAALSEQKKSGKAVQRELIEAQKREADAEKAVRENERLSELVDRRKKAEADIALSQAALTQVETQKRAWGSVENEIRALADKTENARKTSEAANALLAVAVACEQDEQTAQQKEKERQALLARYNTHDAEIKKYDRLCEMLLARENELREKQKIETEVLAEARRAYEQAHRLNAAAALRSALRDGDECPVCGGTFHGGAGNMTEDEALSAASKRAVEESEKRSAAYAEELQKNAVSAADAKAKKDAARLRLEGVTADGKRIAGEVKQLRARIAERLGGKTFAQVREQAETCEKAYENAKKQWESKSAAFAEAKTELTGREAAANEKLSSSKAALAALPTVAVDEQALLKAQSDRDERKERVQALSAQNGAIEEKIAQLSAQLQKKKELSAQKKEINETLELVLRLYACTNKDKLLSFVAEQYIQSFTAAGGETLRSLLDGKYTLEYNDGEFYVVDFFADNARRKVRTLSGGETFLASMSIAMAISRALAGQNYEFFFLDEGFGTLHERAVLTVAAALKELSKTTTVGLVTHRTELADTVGTRLNVIAAVEGESSKVEYIDM